MSLKVNWFQALNKWESELFQGQREILNYAYLKSRFILTRKAPPCIHCLKQIKEISPPLQAKLSHSQPIETNPNFKKAKKKRKNISIYQIIYNDIYKYKCTYMHACMWINDKRGLIEINAEIKGWQSKWKMSGVRKCTWGRWRDLRVRRCISSGYRDL